MTGDDCERGSPHNGGLRRVRDERPLRGRLRAALPFPSPSWRRQQPFSPPTPPAWSTRTALSTIWVRRPLLLPPPLRWSHFHRRQLLSQGMQEVSSHRRTAKTPADKILSLTVHCARWLCSLVC